MRANRVSISARKRAGIPRLTPHPMAPDTARLGTILHTERAARSLKDSPPMEVLAATSGCCGPRILGQLECPVKGQRGAKANGAGLPETEVGPMVGLPEVQNPSAGSELTLVVEVQRELVRVRTQPERVHLVLTLVVDPGLDDLRREHVALEEERMVALEGLQRLVERARRLRHVLELFRSQGVDVLVERLARVELVLDTVEAGHQHDREREVRVRRRVR